LVGGLLADLCGTATPSADILDWAPWGGPFEASLELAGRLRHHLPLNWRVSSQTQVAAGNQNSGLSAGRIDLKTASTWTRGATATAGGIRSLLSSSQHCNRRRRCERRGNHVVHGKTRGSGWPQGRDVYLVAAWPAAKSAWRCSAQADNASTQEVGHGGGDFHASGPRVPHVAAAGERITQVSALGDTIDSSVFLDWAPRRRLFEAAPWGGPRSAEWPGMMGPAAPSQLNMSSLLGGPSV
jgi:hypothetical protein